METSIQTKRETLINVLTELGIDTHSLASFLENSISASTEVARITGSEQMTREIKEATLIMYLLR
jgi:hypothetical protein